MDSLKPLTIGACVLATFVTPSLSAHAAIDHGVVVEEVARGFAGHAAGLQPGDVILSWSRQANPPANPGAGRGEIHTPFDLIEVEIEQAPRGRLTLVGLRGGATSNWVVPQDEWRLNTAPLLSGPLAELYQEGRRLVAAKRAREGAETWRLAAINAKQSGQAWLVAWLSLRAAEVLSASQDNERSAELYAGALGALPEMSEEAVRAQILRSWGLLLLSRNETDEASTRLNEALMCEKRRGADSLAVAWTELALGRVASRSDRFSEAEQHYRRALALQEPHAPQSAAVAETLSRWAGIEMERNPRRGREYAERARSIREAISPATVGAAVDLVQVGWADYMGGDVDSANDKFSRALPRLQGFLSEGRELAYALVGMGNVRFRRGDFSGADALLRQGMDLYDKLAPQGLQVGNVLISLGSVALRRGDLEMAEAHYQRARAILEKANPSSPGVSMALHQLGDVAFARGDFAGAEGYLRRALTISETQGRETLGMAFDLVCFARALGRQGHFDAAEEHARRSLVIRERLMAPGSYDVSWSQIVLGELALGRGDLDTALARYEQGAATRSKLTPASAMAAEPLYGIGRVLRKQGRLASAAEALAGAVEALEQQGTRLGGTEEGRAGFGGISTGPYREYLEVLLELGRPDHAFLALERSRARALLAMLAEREALLSSDLSPELVHERQANHAAYDAIQAQLSRLKPGKDEHEIERLQGRLRELREEAARIVATIRQSSPRAASLQYPQPLDLSGARATLDPGTALLAYSVGESATTLFVVKAEGAPGAGLEVFTLPAGHQSLREKVERFRRLVESPDRGSFLADATQLYELLVGPAESALASSLRLVISPDGPLHVLPFAALVRSGHANGTPQYLVEWKPLHVVASATVYAEIKKGRHGQSSPARTAMAAFGDPLYPPAKPGSEGTKDPELRRVHERGAALSPLPSTRAEVQGIATLYPGARTFLGGEATEERVKTVAKDVRYLHIASHAVLDERLPLNSGLALSIPENPEPGMDNGLLQAWEIFDGLRIDADLVTLSACNTALGKDVGGEGLLGLTRAFQYAGARSVLASLWSVADRSTAKLMRSFYRNLSAGKPKDESLRAAQLELLRSGGPAAHPRHWAAFEVFGDWK